MSRGVISIVLWGMLATSSWASGGASDCFEALTHRWSAAIVPAIVSEAIQKHSTAFDEAAHPERANEIRALLASHYDQNPKLVSKTAPKDEIRVFHDPNDLDALLREILWVEKPAPWYRRREVHRIAAGVALLAWPTLDLHVFQTVLPQWMDPSSTAAIAIEVSTLFGGALLAGVNARFLSKDRNNDIRKLNWSVYNGVLDTLDGASEGSPRVLSLTINVPEALRNEGPKYAWIYGGLELIAIQDANELKVYALPWRFTEP